MRSRLVRVLPGVAGESVVPATVEAVSAYATIGEIIAVLGDVHGSWVPSQTP